MTDSSCLNKLPLNSEYLPQNQAAAYSNMQAAYWISLTACSVIVSLGVLALISSSYGTAAFWIATAEVALGTSFLIINLICSFYTFNPPKGATQDPKQRSLNVTNPTAILPSQKPLSIPPTINEQSSSATHVDEHQIETEKKQRSTRNSLGLKVSSSKYPSYTSPINDEKHSSQPSTNRDKSSPSTFAIAQIQPIRVEDSNMQEAGQLNDKNFVSSQSVKLRTQVAMSKKQLSIMKCEEAYQEALRAIAPIKSLKTTYLYIGFEEILLRNLNEIKVKISNEDQDVPTLESSFMTWTKLFSQKIVMYDIERELIIFCSNNKNKNDVGTRVKEFELFITILGGDVNRPISIIYSESIVNFVAKMGHTEYIPFLAKKGADFNRPGPDGNTALLWAIANAKNSTALEIIKHGKNFDAKCNPHNGNTALILAISKGYRKRSAQNESLDVSNVDLVRELLPKADPNQTDDLGNSPLKMAVIRHDIEMVEEILKYNPKIDFVPEEVLSLTYAEACQLLEKQAGVYLLDQDTFEDSTDTVRVLLESYSKS